MEKAAAAAAAEEHEETWAWTWGAGTDGQLGNGGFQDHHLPQPLLLPPPCRGRVSFVAGGGAHTIALASKFPLSEENANYTVFVRIPHLSRIFLDRIGHTSLHTFLVLVIF
ncbi:hypothetical protein ACQ4PT_041563 [Festuca glaucescens]